MLFYPQIRTVEYKRINGDEGLCKMLFYGPFTARGFIIPFTKVPYEKEKKLV